MLARYVYGCGALSWEWEGHRQKSAYSKGPLIAKGSAVVDGLVGASLAGSETSRVAWVVLIFKHSYKQRVLEKVLGFKLLL